MFASKRSSSPTHRLFTRASLRTGRTGRITAFIVMMAMVFVATSVQADRRDDRGSNAKEKIVERTSRDESRAASGARAATDARAASEARAASSARAAEAARASTQARSAANERTAALTRAAAEASQKTRDENPFKVRQPSQPAPTPQAAPRSEPTPIPRIAPRSQTPPVPQVSQKAQPAPTPRIAEKPQVAPTPRITERPQVEPARRAAEKPQRDDDSQTADKTRYTPTPQVTRSPSTPRNTAIVTRPVSNPLPRPAIEAARDRSNDFDRDSSSRFDRDRASSSSPTVRRNYDNTPAVRDHRNPPPTASRIEYRSDRNDRSDRYDHNDHRDYRYDHDHRPRSTIKSSFYLSISFGNVFYASHYQPYYTLHHRPYHRPLYVTYYAPYYYYTPYVYVPYSYTSYYYTPTYYRTPSVTVVTPLIYPALPDGWALLRAHNPSESQIAFVNAINANPDRGIHRIGYALTSALLGDDDAAALAMRDAVQSDPDALFSVPRDEAIVSTLRGLINHYFARADISAAHVDDSFMIAALAYIDRDFILAKSSMRLALATGDTHPTTYQLRDMTDAQFR